VVTVAIDFETANSSSLSACSVGLAKMENGVVVDTFYSLLNPISDYFDPNNIAIHGIKASDVKDAPKFKEVWFDILSFIGNELVLAHNAPFDIGILKAMLVKYNLELPSLNYACTLNIARRVWPDLPSHKLTFLSKLFGFDYQAHNALDDAINCLKVFYKACPCTQQKDVYAQLKQLGVSFRKFGKDFR